MRGFRLALIPVAVALSGGGLSALMPPALMSPALAAQSSEKLFDRVYEELRHGPQYESDVPTGRIELTRNNRDGLLHRYLLLVPESYDPARRYPVSVFLHGGVGRPDPGPGGGWWRNTERVTSEDHIAVIPLSVDSIGRRNTSGRCGDGAKQASTSGSSSTSTDAFTRSSAGGTPRASAEVLGRSRSRSVERSGCRGRWRVPCCRGALVSRMWWHATSQSSSSVGALLIVRRARRDCRPSSPRVRRAQDRPAVGSLTVNDLERTAAERGHTGWKPRVSGHDRPMARRSASDASESCQTRCERRTEAVCTGSPRRPDRGSRRSECPGAECALDRAAPRSPTRPTLGGLVES